MLERDHDGLNINPNAPRLRGGVAPCRHALSKLQFIEKRNSRLKVEAKERQRFRIVELADAAAKSPDGFFNAIQTLLRRHNALPGAQDV